MPSNTLVLGICIAIAVIFVALAVLLWLRDRRGAALRSFAVSCAVLGLYLAGLVDLLWRAGTAVVGWARDLVLDTPAWIGIALLALTVLCWIIGGRLMTRRIRKIADGTYISPARKKANHQPVTAGPARTTDQNRAGDQNDDDLDDVEDILKSRGIE